jgi:hypothetical protein
LIIITVLRLESCKLRYFSCISTPSLPPNDRRPYLSTLVRVFPNIFRISQTPFVIVACPDISLRLSLISVYLEVQKEGEETEALVEASSHLRSFEDLEERLTLSCQIDFVRLVSYKTISSIFT